MCSHDKPPRADGREPVTAKARAELRPAVPRAEDPTPSTNVERVGPPVRADGTIFGASELMGTQVSINVYLGPDRGAAEAARAAEVMQDALQAMAEVEAHMSEWQPDSELSRLSAAAGGEPQPVSEGLFEVLERARAISQASDGAFDVTFHGVGTLWSFRPGSRPPTREAIEQALPLVDWRQVVLDSRHRTVRLGRAGMKIGLGAIAKGYAVDRAAEVLRAHGYPNHVVEAGGDTYVSGRKGSSRWRVGIQDPERATALGALEAENESVVTSGDYQRFFEFEGQRYAHILDPRTGWPVAADRSPRSVTVVAANATDADGYCTAIAVMGAEAGFRFAEAHPGLGAVIITSEGEVRVTSRLASRIEWASDARDLGAREESP